MRGVLPLAVLVLSLLAGCFGTSPPATTTTSGTPTGLPDGVSVHGGAGEPLVLTPATYLVGTPAFEPTLGVDPSGAIYFATADGSKGTAVGFEPDVYKSTDGGRNWTAVGPRLPTGQSIPPETNDPFIYVDPATGRVFQFAMAPILTCSVLSWSDDGGATWTTNPHGCGNTPPWDHQSMVAAAPRLFPTSGYPNVLIQCVNQIAGAACSRSLNGGFTWEPGTTAYTFEEYAQPALTGGCGGSSVHGHPKSAPDGTVYLPSSMCGTRAIVAITRDDATTWQVVEVTSMPVANNDPVMAVDANGTAYYAFLDREAALWVAWSTDAGATWSEPVQATPPGMAAALPTMAAGSAGRIALAYPGTFDIAAGVDDAELAWHPYVTASLDAGAPNATFTTVRTTPADDPIVRGPCQGRCAPMVDFIGAVAGPDGRLYASFVDGCIDACVGDGKDQDDAEGDIGLLVTIAEPFLGPHFAYPKAA